MCSFFPVSKQEITDWNGEDTDFLLQLDSHGIFPAPNENEEDFRQRLLTEYAYCEKIAANHGKNGKILLYSSPDGSDKLETSEKDRIANSLFAPAWEKTQQLYNFAVDYVPGFYLYEKVGMLWGGCSLYDDETQMKVFLLRPVFKQKDRFLIYDRTELIAHELCHCARQVLNDHDIEEYFAYQTSKSALRRYLGNCFIKEFDAILFLLPALLLPVAQAVRNFVFPALPIFPFWLFLGAVLGFFLIRNHRSSSAVAKAGKKLSALCKNPDAILFRSTLKEIKIIAEDPGKYFASLSPLRRKIIDFHLNSD